MQRWSREKINEWYERQPWLVGCNFIPSTASNQLEMWQAESFDIQTISRELKWASELGMNAVRVYLHDLVWEEDAEGFKNRISTFLETADSCGIRTIFVLFDDCWFPDPETGPQKEPVPGYHNSRWVNSPGPEAAKDPGQEERLKNYIQDIVGTFASDNRILLWDVYNEVGNVFLPILARPWYQRIPKLLYRFPLFKLGFIPTLPLFRKSVAWIREVNPSQPLTASVYISHNKLNRILIESSDIITFHHYEGPEALKSQIDRLSGHGRPLICTEYLNRTNNCLFENSLPLFREHKTGCFNWGLVAGRTQTWYAWSRPMPDGREPDIWFHDILRKDGSPYSQEEAGFIRRMTGAS